MSREFGQENFYLFTVDAEKNHIFLKPMGDWKDPSEIPNYLNDLGKALMQVKKGFSMLVDLNDMKPPRLKVTSMLKENQKMIADAGVRKTAVILPEGQILKKLSLSVVGKLSGLAMRVFNNLEEAHSWLASSDMTSDPDLPDESN